VSFVTRPGRLTDQATAVPTFDQMGLAAVDHLRHCPDRGRDHRAAQRDRFEDCETLRLAV